MSIWREFRKAQDSWNNGRAKGIEVVSGMPMALLDIFADIPYLDTEKTVERFWTWPGEIGEYLQCHLWDAIRLAAILDVRRRKRCREAARDHTRDSQELNGSPCTEVVLCRLMAIMHTLHATSELPENQHLLVSNGLVFPLVVASLEVPLLKRHSAWKGTLAMIRRSFEE
ncbi:hypothetical protein NW759_017682, partial [Fusarium solani]